MLRLLNIYAEKKDDGAPNLVEQVQSMKPPKIIKREDSSKDER